MRRNSFTRGWLSHGAAVLSLLLCCISYSAAQTELTGPKVEARGTIGGATFNGTELPHGIFGGSVRVYVWRRLSVEPEVLYLYHSENDRDVIIQPNIAVDLMKPTGRFVPYAIGGIGAMHHRGRFTSIDFATGAPQQVDARYTTWTASIGGGVKIFVTDKLFIAPEARVGREPTLRGTLSVGYVFSGRDKN